MPMQSNAAHVPIDLLEVFRERCEARAYLVEVGYLPLHQAVDELQASAVRDGLVDQIGQDAIQKIMAAAFVVRRR